MLSAVRTDALRSGALGCVEGEHILGLVIPWTDKLLMALNLQAQLVTLDRSFFLELLRGLHQPELLDGRFPRLELLLPVLLFDVEFALIGLLWLRVEETDYDLVFGV